MSDERADAKWDQHCELQGQLAFRFSCGRHHQLNEGSVVAVGEERSFVYRSVSNQYLVSGGWERHNGVCRIPWTHDRDVRALGRGLPRLSSDLQPPGPSGRGARKWIGRRACHFGRPGAARQDAATVTQDSRRRVSQYTIYRYRLLTSIANQWPAVCRKSLDSRSDGGQWPCDRSFCGYLSIIGNTY
jgi:hypothetical protein